MADYKEQLVTGEIKKWQRSHKAIISNPYNGVPFIVFHEEEKTILPNGETISKELPASLKESLIDPDKTFDLLHPVTDQVIGTAKYQDIYIVLYSLYKMLAIQRDTPVVIEE
jgi:hypothetical protein